ncbi:MAG TPA: DUF4339 domain-containing protein [Bradyrhizobium sp.]|jgi:GYF domain 2|nr:DUF4339 domain-containing protein [Bradyrhizobium sp.]
MSERSWFFASQGQQQGPYPEAQLREFIVTGTVNAETLVWTDGMAGWLKARDIPGLLGGASGPPTVPQPGGALVAAGGQVGVPLSIEVGIWSLLGRSLLFVIGLLLVIPAPWTATGFYRWMASRVRVPGRPNFGFTGQVGDIWYVFVAIGLITYAGLTGISYLPYLLIPVQAYLSWMAVRWIAANLSSNGVRLPMAFNGSALGYIGWYLLMYISVITIIGWAWVITAWMRWICRNVSGTRREIGFNATGWGMLWRTVLFSLGCGLLIPIPWVLRWYTAWYVSQFSLVQRTAYANA